MRTTTGTITATGSSNAVTDAALDGYGPASMGVVSVSGTFTTAVVAVEKKLRGGSVWLPLSLANEKTLARTSGTAAPDDSTATSYRVDLGGAGEWRAYVVSGTPTDVAVELASGAVEEFGGILPAVYTTQTSQLDLADSQNLAFGDADDITMGWDGTDFDVLQATANSSIKWGVDGAGIDHVFYGDTASAAVTWDQSADKLIFSGVAKLQLQTIAAATGTAIPVTHSGSFPITQNGAETNTLAIPTFLGQTLTIFVDTDTSGARVITSAQRINQAANTIITLTEVGDFIKLEAITIGGALRWQVVANDGAVLS